tara:strand:+ start:21840 stop:22214 length:375 start_codon:yes stop_codon:yes gene_type:complete
MKILSVVLTAWFSIAFSGAAFADGNDLLNDCSVLEVPSEDATLNFEYGLSLGTCTGMMQGLTNLNKIYEALLGDGALFCTPEQGVTNGEAAKIVLKYLKDNPQKLGQHEVELAVQAFREAFPCK